MGSIRLRLDYLGLVHFALPHLASFLFALIRFASFRFASIRLGSFFVRFGFCPVSSVKLDSVKTRFLSASALGFSTFRVGSARPGSANSAQIRLGAVRHEDVDLFGSCAGEGEVKVARESALAVGRAFTFVPDVLRLVIPICRHDNNSQSCLIQCAERLPSSGAKTATEAAAFTSLRLIRCLPVSQSSSFSFPHCVFFFTYRHF